MSHIKSPLAYEDIREAFDRALSAQKGVRIPCLSRSAAIRLRYRFNYFRKLNREENSQVYPAEHTMHKRSPYDALSLRVPPKGHKDEHVLFIEPHLLGTLIVEEIE